MAWFLRSGGKVQPSLLINFSIGLSSSKLIPDVKHGFEIGRERNWLHCLSVLWHTVVLLLQGAPWHLFPLWDSTLLVCFEIYQITNPFRQVSIQGTKPFRFHRNYLKNMNIYINKRSWVSLMLTLQDIISDIICNVCSANIYDTISVLFFIKLQLSILFWNVPVSCNSPLLIIAMVWLHYCFRWKEHCLQSEKWFTSSLFHFQTPCV